MFAVGGKLVKVLMLQLKLVHLKLVRQLSMLGVTWCLSGFGYS